MSEEKAPKIVDEVEKSTEEVEKKDVEEAAAAPTAVGKVADVPAKASADASSSEEGGEVLTSDGETGAESSERSTDQSEEDEIVVVAEKVDPEDVVRPAGPPGAGPPPPPKGGPPRGPPPKVDTSLRAYYELLRDHRELRIYFMSANFTVASEFMTLIATIDMIEDFQGAVKHRLYLSALVVIKQFTGVIISMLFGGALADSRDRRNSMMTIDLISAFVALLNFIPLYFESIFGVYVVVALYQVLFGLYEPNRGAMLPTMMRGDPVALRQATVLTMTTTMGAMAPIGSAIGGIVVSYFGVKACFILDSFAFLMSAFFLSRMRGDYTPEEREKPEVLDPTEGKLARAFRMYSEGVKYLKTQFWGTLIWLRASIGFQFGAMDVLMVSFSESLPGDSTMNLAYLYLTLGLGSFVGPAGAASVNGGAPKLINFQFAAVVGLFINFIGNSGMGFSNSLLDTVLSVCIFNVCRASGGKIVMVNSRMLLQSFPEDNMLGRVMSLDYAVFFSSAAIGAVVAGLLEDVALVDTTSTTFICACLLAVAAQFWAYYHLQERGGADPRARAFDERGPPGAKKPLAIKDDAEKKKKDHKENPAQSAKSKRIIYTIAVLVFIGMMCMIFTVTLSFYGLNDLSDSSTSETSHHRRMGSLPGEVELGISGETISLSDFAM